MADLVVVASSFTKQTLVENGVAEGKVRVLPYGVGEEWLAAGRGRFAAPAPGNRPFRFLYAGYLTKRKGLTTLLEAWEEMGLADAELHLIGGGELDRACPSNVVLLGQTPREKLLREMSETDAFVFPSLFEGFGLVILEAMATGLPVITTPHTAGPDLIEPGKEGLIVPAADVRALGHAMMTLRGDPERAREMGRAAHATALCYTWDRYGEGYVGLLGELYAEGGPTEAPRHC